MKRFLFIGHDASRSGAPFVLLYLLQWIRSNHPDSVIDLLLLNGGELEDKYRKVADVEVLPEFENTNPLSRAFRRMRGAFDREYALRIKSLPHFEREYDAVIGNTVVTLRHLALFKNRGFQTVSWLHELDRAVEALGMTEDLKLLSPSIDRFIVGSGAVAEMLGRFGVSSPVDRVYEFSPRGSSAEIDVTSVRRELNIPADAFVVGACGTVENRKGTDLFIGMARKLLMANPEFRFLWIARKDAESDPMYKEVIESIRKHGLNDRVMIIRSEFSPANYLAALDIFVLSSREDPFPLVCLEAANLGKPVVCFADAGGMPEFVGDDAGAVVPFEDVDAMARSIESFYQDPEKRKKAGRIAQRKAQTDFSTETACRSIFQIITLI